MVTDPCRLQAPQQEKLANKESEPVKILLVGGSGFVGTLVTPYLRNQHQIRVLDLQPPQDARVEHLLGSAAEPETLALAVRGVQGLVYLVQAADLKDPEANRIAQVDTLEQVLQAAIQAGVTRAVYASSMSVYRDDRVDFSRGESTVCDNLTPYGLSKRAGERVCEAHAGNLAVVALRLNLPLSARDWQWCVATSQFRMQTEAGDVARAIHLALTRPLRGFHAVNVAGDWQGRYIVCDAARALLGWEPRARPHAATLCSMVCRRPLLQLRRRIATLRTFFRGQTCGTRTD